MVLAPSVSNLKIKMSIKLYYDLMSQPSRALYIILKDAGCKFEPKVVDLRKGIHFSEDFSKINRFQKVPVIDHQGFILTESVAIIKYLGRENLIPENLYPRNDSKSQARVDEYLDWQHLGLRIHCAMYFWMKYLLPQVTGADPEDAKKKGFEKRMTKALQEFNDKWLGRGTDFINGDTPTVADVFAACEIEQPRMAGFEPEEHYPNIAVWIKKVRKHFHPHYEEAHVVLNKVVHKRLAAAKL